MLGSLMFTVAVRRFPTTFFSPPGLSSKLDPLAFPDRISILGIGRSGPLRLSSLAQELFPVLFAVEEELLARLLVLLGRKGRGRRIDGLAADRAAVLLLRELLLGELLHLLPAARARLLELGLVLGPLGDALGH